MWCVKMEKEAFIDLYDKDSNKTGKITDMELSHVAEYAELFVSVFNLFPFLMPSRGMIHGQ